MNSKVKFITLGCKVNQYETQGMREALGRAGVEEAPRAETSCDFVVINTCTVTEEADRENRYWIRRSRREHPNAKIVVTGCYVERNRKEIEALPEVDLVLSNHEKADIAGRLVEGCATPVIQDDRSLRHRYTPLVISRTDGYGRAFVKIQDGCNHACTFCKVVMVRGRSRSRGLQEIVEEVIRLRDSGYREIVFAGIQLGAYGFDLERRISLVDVLRASAEIDGIERLRLSSIEPTDVTPELIEVLRDIPKGCHHLHIPLQSGDDEILKAMNRRYGRSFYIDLAGRLRAELSDFSLTLDVMAGFPGEEERQFENTLGLLEAVKPLKCHVFPYSRREGTRASRLADLPPEAVRRRVQSLMDLGVRLGRVERTRYLGREFPVLIEKKDEKGWAQGLTSNYLKACFQTDVAVGEMVFVKFLALQGDTFLATAQTVVHPVGGQGGQTEGPSNA